MISSPSKRCPACGAPQGSVLLGENCPACLMGLGVASAEAGAPEDAPAQLGGYMLGELLAEGGMGRVFRARHAGLGRVAAVKVIHGGRLATGAAVQRFYVEARAAAALDHPHIVPVFEVGEDDGRHFLAMKLMTGGSLAGRIEQRRLGETPIPPEECAALTSKIAFAVAFAHQRGVLHRDLKPANILLDERDEPHVADFGLARFDDGSDVTLGDVVAGTPAYLSPEVARGGSREATTASDVYSLGVLLYEMIEGRPPFVGATSFETLRLAAEGEPPPMKLRRRLADGRNGTDLKAICLRAMAKDPQRRYPSASAMGDDLNRWLRREPVDAAHPSAARRIRAWIRRRPALTASLTVAAGSLAAGGALFLSQARVTRLNLYAADLRLASEALRQGDLGGAREALSKHAGANPDFVWRMLWAQCAGDEFKVLGRHPWIVNALGWSPDGRWLVSGSAGSGTVGDDLRLWDVRTGAGEILATNGARSVAWLPGGGGFVAAHTDGKVRVWEMPARRVSAEYPGYTASLSADGRRLATCEAFPFAWEAAGRTVVRRLADGALLREFPKARLAALSADGRTAAVSDVGGYIRLYDVDGGALVREFPLENEIWRMVFSPDGSTLTAAGWRREIRVWRLGSGESTAPELWPGHALPSWDAAFNPSGTLLATTGSDQTVRLWKAPSGEPVAALRGHESEVWCAAFSPDGSLLATGGKDRSVRLWKTARPAAATPWNAVPDTIPFFSPDGRLHFPITAPGGYPVALSVDPSHPEAPPRAEPPPLAWAIPAGPQEVLSSAGELQFSRWTWAGRRLEGDLRLEPAGHAVVRWKASPDGTVLAGADSGGNIVLWNLPSGTVRAKVALGSVMSLPFVWSPDGRWLGIPAGEPGGWLISGDGRRVHPLRSHLDEVKAVAFMPSGATAVSASVDGTVKFWDVESGRETGTLRVCRTSADTLDISPDGLILAVGEGEVGVHFWRLDVRREVATVEAPAGGSYMGFSPDGRSLTLSLSDKRLLSLACP